MPFASSVYGTGARRAATTATATGGRWGRFCGFEQEATATAASTTRAVRERMDVRVIDPGFTARLDVHIQRLCPGITHSLRQPFSHQGVKNSLFDSGKPRDLRPEIEI